MIIASLPFGTLIIAQAPQRYYGPVTSSRTTIGQFFFAAGLALSTVLVDRVTVGGVSRRLDAAGVPPTQTGAGLDAVTAYASTGTQPATSLGQQALADGTSSYGTAFAVTMIVTAVLMVVIGAVGVLLLRRAGALTVTGRPAGELAGRNGVRKTAPMAYDHELADRIRERVGREKNLSEKAMFGGLAFLINGHMAVCASSQGGVMLRVDPAQSEELIQQPKARRMVMRGREMDGWLYIDGDVPDDELAHWVDRGVRYVKSLPAK